MGKRTFATISIAIAAGILVASAGAAVASAAGDESAFVSKINRERSSRGMRTLSVRSDLVSIARRQSARMAAEQDIWHNRNLANEVSGNWTEVGENVGVGPDVPVLHKAFMDSPSHRDNILHRSYNQIGVGVVYGKDGNIYVTEVFATRGGTTTVASTATKTTTRPRSTTTSSAQSPAPRAVAAAAKPKPAPVPVAPAPRTVDLLERMVGLDPDAVEPDAGS